MRRAHENLVAALTRAGIDVTTDPTIPFDILHVHAVGPGSLYMLERYAGRRPVITHGHVTTEDFVNNFRLSTRVAPYLSRYLRYFHRKADLVIAPSPYARTVLERYDFDRPIEVVSNGVDLERFAPGLPHRAAGRARYGLRGLVPFSVGLVIQRKGVDLFCDVARRLPDMTLVWFGRIHPAVTPETRRIISRAPDNVLFTGYVEDVAESYAAGDVFFFPSGIENEGIAVLEAAACGRPLLLRDAECFAGRFVHGVSCLKGGSADEFAGHLRTLAADRALYNVLSAGARRVAEEHSLDLVSRRLREIYATLM